MKEKRAPRQCVYCGEIRSPWTDDHIPPKSIIGRNHGGVVPSCLPCNATASKDDEYFAFAIAMGSAVDGHPEIEGIRRRIIRGLGKAEAKRYRALILRNFEPDSRNAGPDFGTYIERLKRVAVRIVRGLYYVNNAGSCLPRNYLVTAFIEHECTLFEGLRTDGTGLARVAAILAPLQDASDQSIPGIGSDLFEYAWARLPGSDAFATVWYLSFFQGYRFLIHSLPRDDPRALATHFPDDTRLSLLPRVATINFPACSEISTWALAELGIQGNVRAPKAQQSPGVVPIMSGRLGKYVPPETA